MTSAEFTEAMAFEQIEPDPAEVTQNLLAQLLALFANVYRERDEAPYAPADFLPGGDRRERLAQGMAVMAQYAAHHAARRRTN